jgi:hypothetical protein
MVKTVAGLIERLQWLGSTNCWKASSVPGKQRSAHRDIALLTKVCHCSLALVLYMPGALCGAEYKGGDVSTPAIENFPKGVEAHLPAKITASSGYRPSAMPISSYCGDSAFSPLANTFTTVSRATEIDLPYSSSVPVGGVIGLLIGGLQESVALRTGCGTNDEVIVVDGGHFVDSVSLSGGDELFLVNKGGGYWSLVVLLRGR